MANAIDKLSRRWMALTAVLALSFLLTANAIAPSSAQGTLVPPTLLPPYPTPTATPTPSQSVLARIKSRATTANKNAALYVGIPFNLGRFSSISTTSIGGEISVEGFEPDLARAIAADWGVDIHFVQVTHQNAQNLLLSGQIDLLMGQIPLTRDAQDLLDYSDPIFTGKQVALTMADFKGDIKDLNGKTVGVVIGSAAEKALSDWAAANNVQVTVNRYAMLDDAVRVFGKDIVAIVADRWELDQKAGNNQLPNVKLLNTPFRIDPYAIAMPRYDASLRTLVNRTLQRLADSKRIDPIYDSWFPKGLMPVEERITPRVWPNLSDDHRSWDSFPTDILKPANPVVSRLKAGQHLRVTGLGAPLGANGQPAALEAFNEAIIAEMARRWGVQVDQVASTGSGEDALASGQADLAVGLIPHWSDTDRVDYVGIYAQRGYRIMARQGSGIKAFDDLLFGRREVGYFTDDPGAFDLAKKTLVSINVLEATIKQVGISNDADAVDMVFNNNVRIVFGDGFRLVPLVAANSAKVIITDKVYNAKPISMGVPRNDADFRVLVDVTLQEMVKDGTYQRLWKDKFNQGDPLSMVIWPGTNTPFGIKTSG